MKTFWISLVAVSLLLANGTIATAAGEAAGKAGKQAAAGKVSKSQRIADWFASYDEIRHQAQMSESERSRSKQLLATGLTASLIPGQTADKEAASALVKSLVSRYTKAGEQMESLTPLAETKRLHKGYQDYFANAKALFSDYLKVQDNMLATDSSGKSILMQLQERKAMLEQLDVANKDLDSKLRAKFKIAPYAY